jgi:hypothetical protein
MVLLLTTYVVSHACDPLPLPLLISLVHLFLSDLNARIPV